MEYESASREEPKQHTPEFAEPNSFAPHLSHERVGETAEETYPSARPSSGLAAVPPLPASAIQREAGSTTDASTEGTESFGPDGLPTDLKRGIEGLSGIAADDVRVHYNSSRPAQFNALAHTQGANIFVGPGQEKHLAHEAWHTVQQKQGRVSPNIYWQGHSVNTERHLEAEADLMGARARQFGRRKNENAVALLQRQAHESIQFKYCRGGTEITDTTSEWEVLNTYATSDRIDTALQNSWVHLLPAQGREILGQWMADESTIQKGIREALGGKMTGRSWIFANEEEAIRALIAESKRNVVERTEARLAKQVLESTPVLTGLRRYITKLKAYVTRLEELEYVEEDWLKKTGKYEYYYQSAKKLLGFTTTIDDVISNPNDYDMKYLIAALKDASTEFFKLSRTSKIAETSVQVPPEMSFSWYRDSAGEEKEESIDTVRPGEAIREGSETMKSIRRNSMLVDHGPSYSTGRLMQLGKSIGATDAELEAVAWALFAFWNQGYWRSTSGIHHFHFVMDMLKNYVTTVDSFRYPADLETGMSDALRGITATEPEARPTAVDPNWTAPEIERFGKWGIYYRRWKKGLSIWE